jgi:hypothetical protein
MTGERKLTNVICSCGNPVERDQSPWDKSEWLCDACHAELKRMRRDREWIWATTLRIER